MRVGAAPVAGGVTAAASTSSPDSRVLRVYDSELSARPGLNMTRAFGDLLAARVGVTCDPEVACYSLQPTDKYLILCTDGITEFINANEIVEMVHTHTTPREAAQALVAEARRRWVHNDGRHVDDCSVIVCFLDVSA